MFMDRSNIRIVYEIGIHCEPYEISQSNINTHSFDIFSLKNKFWSILINRKVVTKWELFKTELFWTIYHYSGRKTIKTEKKQTLFLHDEPIVHNFWSIGKFRLKTLVFEVFFNFLYVHGLRSYIIKTFCWFQVEGDQTYLI